MVNENLTDEEYIDLIRKRGIFIENIYIALKQACGNLNCDVYEFKNYVTTLVTHWLFNKDGFVICTHPVFATDEARSLQQVLNSKNCGVNIFSEEKFILANYKNKEIKVYIKKLKPDVKYNEKKKIYEEINDEVYDTKIIMGPVKYELKNIKDFPLNDDDLKLNKDKKDCPKKR